MKKIKIIALLICLMIVCLFGCSYIKSVEAPSGGKQISSRQDSNGQNNSKMHSIEVTDIKKIISRYPKSAKAGDKVTIKTNCFMDAIPIINVNGNDIGEWDDNKTEYTFIMPDEDVKIETTLKSSGMA